MSKVGPCSAVSYTTKGCGTWLVHVQWEGGAVEPKGEGNLFSQREVFPQNSASIGAVSILYLSLETVPWIRYILLSPVTHVYLKHGIFTWGYCLTWLLWTVVIYKIFGDFSRLDPFSGHFLISWFLEIKWKGAATFGKTHYSFFSCLRSRDTNILETNTNWRLWIKMQRVQISDIVCDVACGVIMLFVRLEEEQQSITDYSDVWY